MSAGFYFIGIDNCKYNLEAFSFTVHLIWLCFMERRYSNLRISVFTLMICWPLVSDRIWKRYEITFRHLHSKGSSYKIAVVSASFLLARQARYLKRAYGQPYEFSPHILSFYINFCEIVCFAD